jgi:lambda family phage portal protein
MAYLRILDSRGNKIPVSAQSAFEGARAGRRLGSWMASTSGINSLISGSINNLRSRSRHLRRNNPLTDGGVDSFVSDLIGTGISPSWQLKDQNLKKTIQELWNDWTEEADYTGTCDFYGLQSLVSQALIESGEALVRIKPQSVKSDLSVPLQLQVLEGDHLDENYSTTLANGNSIRMGIEFDGDGKRVAYHLWPEHPGENYGFSRSLTRIRVPAEEICHVYRPTRPGQIRGTSWLASVIVKLYDFDQYDDAELVRKKAAAMFGGFITEPPGGTDNNLPFGESESTDSSNREIVPLEPGTFPVLPPGMDVTFSQPADVGGNYEKWVKQQLRSIARGIGTTYEKLTGDLTDVNYSSIRAGLLAFQRFCKQIQLQTLAFQLCRPIAHIFLDIAVLSGALTISDYARNKRAYRRIKWRPDSFPWVDPVKDQLADQSAVRNGFKSRAQVVAERGGDIEELDAEIKSDNQRADDYGFVFDSDPRRTAKSGLSQAMENAAVTNAEDN